MDRARTAASPQLADVAAERPSWAEEQHLHAMNASSDRRTRHRSVRAYVLPRCTPGRPSFSRAIVVKGETAVVPTTIPFRAIEPHSDEGLASFCGALLLFYSVFTLMLLSLTAAEVHFGMYPGLTF
jgi:hypothetical protein